MGILALLAIIMFASEILIRSMMKLLYNADKSICRSLNYRGKAIPAIGGIVFVPILLIAVLLLLFLQPGHSFDYLCYLLLVICMGFIGVLDDLLGDKSPKGLVTHFKSTFRGVMTTGFLKAFAGLLAAGIISFVTAKTLEEYIINAGIISLFANTVNLFDLRPGRALKVYLIFSLLLLITASGRLERVLPLIVLCLAVILFIPYDLKEICMLGDTGANILGITLGYYSALLLSCNMKLFLLALLVFVNLISEKVSMTDIIKRNRLLDYIDRLGRRQTDNR